MEAISTHARQARQAEQDRRYSQTDLTQHVGVTPGNAYLVQPEDDDDFVMVVQSVAHDNDDAFLESDTAWRRPMGVQEDEFLDGIVIHAEFYRIRTIQNGAYVTHDDPFETARLFRNALKHFPRRTLNQGRKDNTFAHPSMF